MGATSRSTVAALSACLACLCQAFAPITGGAASRPALTDARTCSLSNQRPLAWCPAAPGGAAPGYQSPRRQARTAPRLASTTERRSEDAQRADEPHNERPLLGVRTFGRKLRGAAKAIGRFNGNVATYTSTSLGLSFGVRKLNAKQQQQLVLQRSGGADSAAAAAAAAAQANGAAAPAVNGAAATSRSLRRKVLILMSDTGGGHRASAQALQAAFEMEYPGCIDVSVVDVWTDHGKWPFTQFVPYYQFMARHPPIWRLFWEYGKFPVTRKLTEVGSNLVNQKSFRKCIEDAQPDLVISVHPLCQDIPLRAMKKMGGGQRVIPFVTVVTDLGGAHPTWFHPEVDKCFVPSEVLRQTALTNGLRQDQLKLHGLPTRPGFWSPVTQDKASLQAQLGLKPGVKACLVVGGGDGVGGLGPIAEALIERLGEAEGQQQLVVVCGKNEEVRKRLEAIQPSAGVSVKVLGFVKNMDEWMGAVDVIVTKAGPGTIAEATIRGLPIMLSAYLPGQEEGNIPYVVEGGYGAFSQDPAVIASTVTDWLLDDGILAAMSANARLAARPHATTAIARDIGKMIYAPDPPPTLAQAQQEQEHQRRLAQGAMQSANGAH